MGLDAISPIAKRTSSGLEGTDYVERFVHEDGTESEIRVDAHRPQKFKRSKRRKER